MDVKRQIEMTAECFEVGDQITAPFPDREYTATAIQTMDGGKSALFLTDDFLDEPHPMNKEGGTKGGYEQSDMRKHLQQIAENLPDDFKARLKPHSNGDFLRLLTLTEMTGEDENWEEADGQIEWMKDRRHRISIRKGDAYEWGWTATVVSGALFVFVNVHGNADNYAASNSLGVRPAFILNLESTPLVGGDDPKHESKEKSEELKPCPFCGGKADFVDYGTEGEFEDWNVECKNCGILMIAPGAEDGAVTTKEEAAEKWNRRADK